MCDIERGELGFVERFSSGGNCECNAVFQEYAA
jgi:hypothetical protein